MRTLLPLIAFLVQLTVLASCASTTVDLAGNRPKDGLCQSSTESGTALVVWGTQWRQDQKDVPLREAAAEKGLNEYFAQSKCFPNAEVRRTAVGAPLNAEQARRLAGVSSPEIGRVVLVVVRELGPVVKLLSSAAIVEGGTEVVLHITSYSSKAPDGQQDFVVHWKNGGPGVVKGVATLHQDMKAALAAGFEQTTTSSK